MGVHVIAEAGSNHNGSLELALALNQAAAESGADSVKYQIIYPEGLYRQGQYAYGHYDIQEVWRIRESGVMSDKTWQVIAADALGRGIPFSASVFDTRGLDLLCAMNPPYLKIASCDLNHLRFLREVAQRGLPMVVSTGMSSLGDIEKAVATLGEEGIEGEKLVLLHCVSVYPANLADTNLAFLATLKSAFGTAIGFSDHTKDNTAACAAVALGATWLEKHFTVDTTLEGFDHKHAMMPGQLADYVAAVRATEQAIRPKVIKIGPGEKYTRARARRGLYAARELPAGHVLRAEDLLIVRPESAIAADEWEQLVGCRLEKSLAAFEPFAWEGVSLPPAG